MPRYSAAICLILFVSECTIAHCDESTPPPNPQLTVMTLFGTYFRGDGLACNVTIDLKETGDYTARWHGCVTNLGKAKGTWIVVGTVIKLKPASETETTSGGASMKGRLKELHIVRQNRAIVFVVDLEDPYYLKHGVNRISAFHKQEPKSDQ